MNYVARTTKIFTTTQKAVSGRAALNAERAAKRAAERAAMVAGGWTKEVAAVAKILIQENAEHKAWRAAMAVWNDNARQHAEDARFMYAHGFDFGPYDVPAPKEPTVIV